MADPQQHRLGHQPQQQQQQIQPVEGGIKSFLPDKAPTKSQILALVTLVPVGGTLLLLAGLTLAGTVLGLAVSTPVFLLFSPILVPAALTVAGAVMGFLTSGALGITALSSLSWMVNYLRNMRGGLPETVDQAKRRAQDAAGYLGQKTKETVQDRPQQAPGRT